MPIRPTSRRGGPRPSSGRPKVPPEQDPDRFFIVIWRALVRVLGYGPQEAGYLAAHLVSAEPIVMSEVEGALRAASTTVNHHADTLKTRITALVEKAKASSDSDPWLGRSETAIKSLILAAFALARPDLSDDARERLPAAARLLVAQLHELGWGELVARLETRIRTSPRGGASGRAQRLGQLLANVEGRNMRGRGAVVRGKKPFPEPGHRFWPTSRRSAGRSSSRAGNLNFGAVIPSRDNGLRLLPQGDRGKNVPSRGGFCLAGTPTAYVKTSILRHRW
jgi:hypothetical protein